MMVGWNPVIFLQSCDNLELSKADREDVKKSFKQFNNKRESFRLHFTTRSCCENYN